MRVLQNKPKVKNMIINYYDSKYPVIKNREDKKIVLDKYENNFIILLTILLPIIILDEKMIM